MRGEGPKTNSDLPTFLQRRPKASVAALEIPKTQNESSSATNSELKDERSERAEVDNAVELSETDDVELIRELMESTGLDEGGVKELLCEYRNGSATKTTKTIEAAPTLPTVTRRTLEPLELQLAELFPQGLTGENKDVQQGPYETEIDVENYGVMESPPKALRDTRNKPQKIEYSGKTWRQIRSEKREAQHQNILQYLNTRRRNSVESLPALTKRTYFVDKYESEMKRKQEAQREAARAKKESEIREKEERLMRGIASNLAIRKKIEETESVQKVQKAAEAVSWEERKKVLLEAQSQQSKSDRRHSTRL